MFGLYLFGRDVERAIGRNRLLALYVMSVVAGGLAVLELLLGVSGEASGVAHFAHLGGMLGALACLLVWSTRRWLAS